MRSTKKQDIIKAALKLFTENGVRATSTKSIAKEANTSEALIFKHFGTKDGLLEEIIKRGYQDATKLVFNLLNVKDAHTYIHNLIELPLVLVDSNPDFWKMQYNIIALNPISKKYHEHFIFPTYNRLEEAFEDLGFDNPQLETELLLIFIDGVWKSFAENHQDLNKKKSLIQLMRAKYKSYQ